MEKIILITGATSGFGKATAEKFAANNWNCIITGRRVDRIHQIADNLREKYQVSVLPLVFDVQNKTQVQEQLGNLPETWKNIDVLVNNAGLALGRDSFQDASVDDWDIMLDTNVKGLAYVTKAIIPNMMQRKEGHIFNIGSTAAKEVYPNGNGYCASKHAVDALSKSMRIDLLPYKIKVTGVHPGAADTEFSQVRFKGDDEKANSVYVGYKPLYANDIADIIFYCANLPQHVCINDLVVTCTAQASNFNFHKEL